MKVLLYSVLFGSLFLMSACSDDSNPAPPPSTTFPPVPSQGIVAGNVTATLKPQTERLFDYVLKNQTEKPVTLTYSSGQRYDYTITTEEGMVVYQESDHTFFTEAMSDVKLKQGEEVHYTIDTSKVNLEKGTYTLTVSSTDNNMRPRDVSVRFTIK